MATISQQEVSLIRRAAHDQDAFAELYLCYVTRVYRYLLIRAGNVADAQDLTSQTFLTALERIETYRGMGSFAAWILAIARHKMLDHYRSHRSSSLPLETIEDIASSTPSLDDMVFHKLTLHQIVVAIGALGEDRAEALRLHVFGGLSALEVGKVMNRSEAASKMLIHRAIQDLKVKLANEEG